MGFCRILNNPENDIESFNQPVITYRTENSLKKNNRQFSFYKSKYTRLRRQMHPIIISGFLWNEPTGELLICYAGTGNL